MDEAAFDDRVRALYRAATGDEPWEVVLEALRADFGAHAVTLQTVNTRDGSLLGLHRGGPALAQETLDYVRQWHLADPRRLQTLAPAAAASRQWLHSDSWLAEPQLATQPFFQHFLPAYDTRHSAHLAVAVSAERITGFAFEMPAQRAALSADERHWMERIGHHARDALLAHERVRRLLARSLVGHQLLDGVPYAMWLLSAEGALLHANAAAREEQAQALRVALRGGRLRLVHDGDDRRLHQQLQALSAASHGVRAVVALRSPDAVLCRLCLQTLTSAGSMAAFAEPAEKTCVLVTLFDPARVRPLDAYALAEVFALTPAEARVAVLLAQGQTGPEIALRLGVLESTVRTHISKVLAKLGLHSKIEAVRLLGRSGWMWQRADSGL
jgi:DNA-binding NarL/FixJ family response regulator